MGSQIQDLPYLKTNPKYIFFTDFDGTITLQDSKLMFTKCSGVALQHVTKKCLRRQVCQKLNICKIRTYSRVNVIS